MSERGHYLLGTDIGTTLTKAVLVDLEGREIAARRSDVVEALRPIAQSLGVSLAVFSVAWVHGPPRVTAPSVGPRHILARFPRPVKSPFPRRRGTESAISSAGTIALVHRRSRKRDQGGEQ